MGVKYKEKLRKAVQDKRKFSDTAWWMEYKEKLKKVVQERKDIGKVVLEKSDVPPILLLKDVERARWMWDRHIQRKSMAKVLYQLQRGEKVCSELNLKVDGFGLIRCHGRYENADLPEQAKFPILLPKGDPYTRLVIMDSHLRTFHSWINRTLVQVRMRYWIPQGRQSVRTVLKSCRICRREEGGPYQVPLMPPWPKERVSRSPPFTYTGVDYLGPLRIKDKKGDESRKIWICLFTCMSVRAIHLEMVHDMTAGQFLDAIRRFIALRGTPKQFVSDNASQFKLVAKMFNREWSTSPNENPEVQSYLADHGIGWRFIPEISPWMGGFYERLVGEVKRVLKKVIGKRILYSSQMLTLVTEVSAVVNSRPLVYVGAEIEEREILTPADFLGYNSSFGTPEQNCSDLSKDEEYLPKLDSVDKLKVYWRDTQEVLNSSGGFGAKNT